MLSLLMMAEVFASGGKRNGTAGAQELLIPVSARGLAFSGSYVSGISGVDAIYYNPAGLGTLKYSIVGLSPSFFCPLCFKIFFLGQVFFLAKQFCLCW